MVVVFAVLIGAFVAIIAELIRYERRVIAQQQRRIDCLRTIVQQAPDTASCEPTHVESENTEDTPHEAIPANQQLDIRTILSQMGV